MSVSEFVNKEVGIVNKELGTNFGLLPIHYTLDGNASSFPTRVILTPEQIATF